MFGKLEIWFDETNPGENTESRVRYKLKAANQGLHILRTIDLDQNIVFENWSPKISSDKYDNDIYKIPTPSRRYLRIHAALSNIAHLSGAGQAVSKFWDDISGMKVLAADGEDATLFKNVLFTTAVIL